MSEQEHSGATIDLKPEGFVGIELTRASVLAGPGARAFVLLPTLESAETLRDALSAFLEFHRSLPPLPFATARSAPYQDEFST